MHDFARNHIRKITKERAGLTLFLAVFLFFATTITVLPIRAEVFYPWRDVYIGALEGKEWFGLVLAASRDSVFGFRIRVVKEGRQAEGHDLFYLVSEVGPHSPDGQYSRIKADLSLPFHQAQETPILIKHAPKSETLTLEWSRQNEKAVIGRIRAPKNIELQIVHYFPWNISGEYRLLGDGQVQAESGIDKKLHYLFWSNRQPDAPPVQTEKDISLPFSMEKERELYFVAGVGEDPKTLSNQIYRYKNSKTINYFLLEEGRRYQNKRVRADGLFKGVAEAITNNVFWMTLYQPGHHRLYTPAGRNWIFQPGGLQDHWTVFEWDSFFSALEASVESPKHVRDIIASVLETQYPNGNIPNWRGRFSGTADRSQPPVGAFCVLKLFGKIGDFDLLKLSYPSLKKWHDFWKAPKSNGQARRDGNGDGLLEWGSDADLVSTAVPSWEINAEGKQRAIWESGQDDLPNWEEASFNEETGTLMMNCLDLNSLYALDAYCLAQIANILNLPDDYALYIDEYNQMKRLINSVLWNEREKFYFDRHWDGRFSQRKAASNFYPLLARIPDKEQALAMIKRLLNPKEFWGDYILPTISRDDPLFKEQQYWRGAVWPPTNYLVYQGLKAFGFDAVAAEFAQKSAALFLRSWENFQLCPENFDSRTGEAGGQRFQTWGPLFALIALEEYIDFTPWEGFRFGMLKPEKKGKLVRLAIQGRHYQVEVSNSKIKLIEEEREILKANGGAVFRHFLYSENEVSFEIKTLKAREVEIHFLKKGKYQLLVDNELKRVFTGRSEKIIIPEGDHTVLIQLLEALE
ncbi:MAG: trehalase family glycosidase [Clostridiales bacterium]|nr:trehalase family glycosidase [Clostridiales bacterium]